MNGHVASDLRPARAAWRTSAAVIALSVLPTALTSAQGVWMPTSAIGAPAARSNHAAVWTGSRMIVWGGDLKSAPLFTDPSTNTGGLYDPATDSWQPTSTTGAPTGRRGETTVWTASGMIVWGGSRPSASNLDTGGLYDPATDVWLPTSTTGTPAGREAHTAVWTGSRMIVWGGQHAGVPLWSLNSGGSYAPATDTWTPTSTDGAPTERQTHTAVWTGSRMIVWGGCGGLEPAYCGLDTGGVYDPDADKWTPTSTTGAPAGRYYHTAVWAGSKMIVWGGYNEGGFANTGGIYDPATDTWAPMNTLGAPGDGPAVWTGSRMIVWGDGPGVTNVGGVYDPSVELAELPWQHQATGDLYLWFMEGTRAATGSYLTPSRVADTRWQIRAVADFDGDGQADLLWHNQATGDLYVWFMHGTTAASASYLTPRSFADTRWQIRGAADFDGDGKTDLLWQNQTTGELYVWSMNGTAVASGSFLAPRSFADVRWQIRGVVDFNGDKKPDVLWHNQVTGDLYVWLLDGTVTVGASYLTPQAVPDVDWKVVKVADFDGDKKSDLLWNNRATGDLYVWLMDGTVVKGGGYLTPIRQPDLNWHVVPR